MSALDVHDPVLLSFADEVGATGPVAVAGARTRWDLGGPLDPAARVVQAPRGVVALRPEEMIVAVRAGTAVADLHAELAHAGQRTALPERGGTVGGAVVVGENDLHRLGRGSLRDAVLQVRYVSAEGAMVTGGGPVVKNVSGFNLPKLIVGSLGTLGLVAEVVLRTNPVPARSLWIAAAGADPRQCLDAVLRPGAVLSDGETTWVQLEGHVPDVEADRARLARLGSFAEVEGPPPLPPHRWSLRPSALAGLDQSRFGSYVASFGVGLVWAEQPAPVPRTDGVVEALARRMKQQFDPSGRLNPGRMP